MRLRDAERNAAAYFAIFLIVLVIVCFWRALSG